MEEVRKALQACRLFRELPEEGLETLAGLGRRRRFGRGAIVIGLAAVIIGEAVFGKIFKNFGFKLIGVVLGSIIYYIVLQIVIWLKIVDTDSLKLLSALIVAVFLAIPFWKNKYFTKSVLKKGGNSNA